MAKLQSQLLLPKPLKLTEQEIKQLTEQLLTEMTAKIKKLETDNKQLQADNKSLNELNLGLTGNNSNLERQVKLLVEQLEEFDKVETSGKIRVAEAEKIISAAQSFFQAQSNNNPYGGTYRIEFGQLLGMYQITYSPVNPL